MSHAPGPSGLVVLDRDGVLNRMVVHRPGGLPESPHGLEEVEILPGVPEALKRLCDAGYVVAIATNQPAAAKGEVSPELLDAIHERVLRGAESAGGRVTSSHLCRHRAEDGCECRKPRPGLLREALAQNPLAGAAGAWMVGDRVTDVLAGQSLGFRTALLGTSLFPGDEARLAAEGVVPFFRGRDLQHFVAYLLKDPLTAPTTLKLFSDGADLASLLEMAKNPRISGFTTNPTLMRKAGISDYVAFAKEVLTHIQDRPISFEVFADEFEQMARQARLIAAWGANVYVKVPITNTRGESSVGLVRELSASGVQLNVTAICTLEQVRGVSQALAGGAPAVISVFAGRIADTGRDPVPHMREARSIIDASGARAELLWASPRELLNIVQAEQAGAHIITVPPDMLKKLSLFGKDLGDY
ncbi:MAG TPA: transaldolase, partial [Polyangiaceae bacterium]|nr:transaldolase [Polyangiaceae bacterium]